MIDNGQNLESRYRNALNGLPPEEPKNLISRVNLDLEEEGSVYRTTPEDLAQIIADADQANTFVNSLSRKVAKLDSVTGSTLWVQDTKPSTQERRDLICKKLGMSPQGATELQKKRPIFRDETVVISEADWEPWYTADVAAERSFYWSAYKNYLLETKRWPEDSVQNLDVATNHIVRRLSDPTSAIRYQSKGLVVGYVQSGKTANFTGVVAKAIDAGYRLIIVMTGTIELLRSQTQRRMDMELVGRKNIVGDLTADQAIDQKVDYQTDPAWIEGEFLDLGTERLETEIERLTRQGKDYQKQFQTLKIQPSDPNLPLFARQNLYPAAARLAIVKKNAAVLKKLVNDIERNRTAFLEIPVLIIDDESDQASVNTKNPEKIREAQRNGEEVETRATINKHISKLLEYMPRAQYVAYTATPFANVFVDPEDSFGNYPKDFVIGLPRPDGYMGVNDFHDIDGQLDDDDERTFANSNEKAFVRLLEAADDDIEKQDQELGAALDLFVLTGAIKLYRASLDPKNRYRHHTMLVHDSSKKADHKDTAGQVKTLWHQAAFTSPAARERLRKAYEADIEPVSAARASETPTPDFSAIEPFISPALSKILSSNGNPLLIVNSDTAVEQQNLDFDKTDTWRILVGGQKLSRGFTVEGLTITYFRRATNLSDTLTQMGRWFGFRNGYKDLVRLYLATNTHIGRKDVNLLEAFRNIGIDETEFRKEIARYSELTAEGKPVVTPMEVPCLVQQHLPWLTPTAKNKMFNAVLVSQAVSPLTAPAQPNQLDQLYKNLNRWRPLLAAASTSVRLPMGSALQYGKTTFDSYVGLVSAQDLLDAVRSLHYLEGHFVKTIEPKLTAYQEFVSSKGLGDFLLVLPQPNSEHQCVINGVGTRKLIERKRREGRNNLFGELTDSKHRLVIEQFANEEPHQSIQPWYQPNRGIALVYLIRETAPRYDKSKDSSPAHADPESGVIVGFSLYAPQSMIVPDQVLRFRVKNPNLKKEAIVSAD
jgi:hypothetical protein